MLTREEIEKMPAGRDLEHLIAETLLGFSEPVQIRTDEDRPWATIYSKVPNPASKLAMRFSGRANVNGTIGLYDKLYMPSPYSKDMSYAWLLWQHCLIQYGPALFGAALCDALGIGVCSETSAVQQLAAFLSPLAICRAALIASLPPTKQETTTL